jgi:FF domain
MLAEQGVTSNWKWEDANRVIQSDTLARYNVFRTMSDRRQAFTEYQNELRVREREEHREHKEETRNNFL